MYKCQRAFIGASLETRKRMGNWQLIFAPTLCWRNMRYNQNRNFYAINWLIIRKKRKKKTKSDELTNLTANTQTIQIFSSKYQTGFPFPWLSNKVNNKKWTNFKPLGLGFCHIFTYIRDWVWGETPFRTWYISAALSSTLSCSDWVTVSLFCWREDEEDGDGEDSMDSSVRARATFLSLRLGPISRGWRRVGLELDPLAEPL